MFQILDDRGVVTSRDFFTVRRYVLAVVMCPSIRPSHADIVLKWLYAESRKQHQTIAQGL